MIHFLASARHGHVTRKFFATWGKEMAERVRIWSYERLPVARPMPAGTWIFTDLERLLPGELEVAAVLADHLAAHPASYRVLNHPSAWLNRFALQRRLSEAGINDFKVWRQSEIGPQVRYPVFVRRDNDHRRSKGLFQNAEALQRHFSRLDWRDRWQKKHLMVVEFANVADGAGLFRKYSALRIDGEIIPRHILFSREWLTKSADVVNAETVAEELAFCGAFPHAGALLEVFRLAGLEYGRVDYGVKEGRLQIWEINSMPVIVPPPGKLDRMRMGSQEASARRIVEAFGRLAEGAPREACVSGLSMEAGRRWRRVQRVGRWYGLIRP